MTNAASYARWSLEPYSIGMKLRNLRSQKRLTLARLAAETGLSTALLSKLETDRMIPTLPTLALICRVYGVGLGYFFSEPAGHTFSITRKVSLQGASRGAESARLIPLNAQSTNPRLITRLLEVIPGGTPCAPLPDEEACAVLYVLEGRLKVETGGVVEILEAGDCAYMETQIALSLCADGDERCRVLTVVPGTPHST